jgi:hypothetical protein
LRSLVRASLAAKKPLLVAQVGYQSILMENSVAQRPPAFKNTQRHEL